MLRVLASIAAVTLFCCWLAQRWERANGGGGNSFAGFGTMLAYGSAFVLWLILVLAVLAVKGCAGW